MVGVRQLPCDAQGRFGNRLVLGGGGGLPSRRQQRIANQFGSRFVELFEQSFDRLQRRCRVAGPGGQVERDLQQHYWSAEPAWTLPAASIMLVARAVFSAVVLAWVKRSANNSPAAFLAVC